MDEKKIIKPHSLTWKGRKQGSITGVKDVLSFDEHSVILETEMGRLTIKGKDLHVDRLMLEQGEVELVGNVESMVYSGGNSLKKTNFMKRMFQ